MATRLSDLGWNALREYDERTGLIIEVQIVCWLMLVYESFTADRMSIRLISGYWVGHDQVHGGHSMQMITITNRAWVLVY